MRLLSSFLFLSIFLFSCSKDMSTQEFNSIESFEIIRLDNFQGNMEEFSIHTNVEEGKLEFDLFISNTDTLKEKMESIASLVSGEEADEIRLKSIYGLSSSSNIVLPLDSDLEWTEKVNAIQLVYISDDGETEKIMGEYDLFLGYDNPKFIIEMDTKANIMEDVKSTGGDLVYRFSFDSIPEGEMMILGCNAHFFITYDLITFE